MNQFKYLKSLLLCCVLLSCNGLKAGDFVNSRYNQRILSVNPGYVFSGSGDCWGMYNEFSHVKSITSWLIHRESIGGWIVNGTSWIDSGFENQTGVDVVAELGIVPFKTGDRIFYLSGGGVFGFISNLSPNGGRKLTITSNDGVTQILNRVSYGAEGIFSPGFSLSAGYITRVNSKIYLNLRAQTKVYNSGEVLSTLTIGIGLNALK